MTAPQGRLCIALQWRFEDVVKFCGVSVGVVQRIEAGDEGITLRSLRKVQSVYERAGVIFNDDGKGIRMRELPE